MKKGKIREHLGYVELTAFTKYKCYFQYFCSTIEIDYNHMKRYLLRTSRQKPKYFKNVVM